MTQAYYNEWERFPAEWLCNLMAAGKITNGRVDQRSIKDVRPGDLIGYSRVHLFAGIAGWELALELAGWPKDLPVWTGSCPCQPFSNAAAGKQKGTNDERDLWPEMLRLIRARRPHTVFGEQVGRAAGRSWAGRTARDLEAIGYRIVLANLCSSLVWLPKRERVFWVAYLDGDREPYVPLHEKAPRLPAAPGLTQWRPEAIRAVGEDEHGVPGGVGRLRAYGNAITPPLAAKFVRAFIESQRVG